MSKFRVSGNKSSILVYPTVKPELSLDFVNNPEGIDPAYSFTRNSSATYVGADGYIKTAGVNQPRFDYDPETGECKGLLIEEDSTNLWTNSSNFTSGWNLQSITTEIIPSSSIYLGNNIIKIIPNNSNSSQHSYNRGTPVTIGIGNGTFSVFAKADGYRYMWIRSDGQNGGALFDLINGEVSTTTSGVTAFIVPHSNNYYRCSINCIFYANLAVRIGVSINTGFGGYPTTSFAGDGVSGILVSSVQLEEKPFPTSYIPTSGSSVTRQPDQLLINKPINLNGTFFIESSISNLKDQQTLFNANDGTNSFVLKNSNGEIKQETTNYISKNYSTTDINSTKRIISYQNSKNIFMSSSNIEDSVDAKTSGNLPFTPDRISIGYDNLNADRLLNGYIKKFSYYPKALTDNECRALVNDKNLVIYSSYKNPIIQQGSEIYHIDQNNFSYWVHEFKTIGSTNITINEELDIEYLIVAGGGGGGADMAGGGGGGEVLFGSIRLTPDTYSIVVGNGGSGGTFGNNGSSGNNSTAFGITAAGGGGGNKNQGNGGNSGSGNVGGSGGSLGSETFSGGGGAGDSANGGNSVPNEINGRGAYGGEGTESLITGTSVRYGGGGGGTYLVYRFVNLTSANIGLGFDGGGRGGVASRNGTFFTPSSGSSNRGGGGGGGNWSGTGAPNGASGGSGIVIIRYKV